MGTFTIPNILNKPIYMLCPTLTPIQEINYVHNSHQNKPHSQKGHLTKP